MRSPYTGFFHKQIIGPEAFDELFIGAMRTELEDSIGVIIGEAVIDETATGTGLGISASADTINNRRLTIDGDKRVVTDSGKLMVVGDASMHVEYVNGDYVRVTHDGAMFEDIPFENDSGTTYFIYIGQTRFPVDVSLARDGSRGYSVYVDAAGFSVTPNVVTLDGDGKIILKLTTALTDLGMLEWLTSHTEDDGWSMDCIVWLNTDTSGVLVSSDDPAIAIASAKLTKDSVSGWRIDLTSAGDGKFGQATASTTASHYKVAILGPLISNTSSYDSDPDYTFIGSVLSGVSETVDVTDQVIVIPYSSYAGGFAVEHNVVAGDPDFGRHKSVTAEEGTDLFVSVDDSSDRLITVRNIDSGRAILVVEDILRVPLIQQTFDLDIDLVSGSDRIVEIVNTGAGDVTLQVCGDVVASTANAGSGNFIAETFYHVDSSELFGPNYDALTMFQAGFHSAGGTGVIAYTNGGGTDVPYVFADGLAAAVKTFMNPMHPPEGFLAGSIRCHYHLNAAGTAQIRVAVIKWPEGATTFTNHSGWLTFNTRAGAWVTETKSFGSAVSLSAGPTDKFYIMVEITNNGLAVNTARLHKATVYGEMDRMPAFQC